MKVPKKTDQSKGGIKSAVSQKIENDHQSDIYVSSTHAGDDILTEKIGEIIAEVAWAKKGDKRVKLRKYFTEDGGLSAIFCNAYKSKRCPYIKIEVQFQIGDTGKSSEDDVIQKISKPYLECPIYD